ncbi:MAG: DeoR/GlpR family DNA-binding transcription regulator [Actinomycetota bacterium]
MFAHQRHDIIVDAVRRQGSVRVRELAELLDVSEMTIRRDLDLLAGRRLVDKVHGGATRVGNQSSNEPGFEAKRRRQLAEKDRIAAAAAGQVTEGTTIGLTAGTTTWALAKHLVDVPGLTVVTNSTLIAQVFYDAAAPDGTVILTGGARTPSDALVGPIATSALARLHVDVIFMGVHGMDGVIGYSTPNLAEAELNSAFLASAQRAVVVADHTKWGVRGLARIAPLDLADLVISDRELPSTAVAAFANLETDLQLV